MFSFIWKVISLKFLTPSMLAMFAGPFLIIVEMVLSALTMLLFPLALGPTSTLSLPSFSDMFRRLRKFLIVSLLINMFDQLY